MNSYCVEYVSDVSAAVCTWHSHIKNVCSCAPKSVLNGAGIRKAHFKKAMEFETSGCAF